MAKRVVFDLDYAGVGQLLKSSEMQTMLSGIARAKALQAGEGYGSDCRVLSTRAVATVFPDSEEAAHDNYENNTLLKVVR